MPMMMGNEATIREYVSAYQNDNAKFSDFFLKTVYNSTRGNKMITNDDSILTMFEQNLKDHLKTVKLSDSDYRKYRCNPKLLSYDQYGTTEYWFLILHANEIYSVSEMTMNPIKLYDINIGELIAKIYSAQKDIIDINEAEKDAALIAIES